MAWCRSATCHYLKVTQTSWWSTQSKLFIISICLDNPISGEDDYRLEMLIALRRLERLDKDEYNDDERQEAQEIYEQRRLEDLTTNNEVGSSQSWRQWD